MLLLLRFIIFMWLFAFIWRISCVFSARQHSRARYMLSPARLSVCPSVRHTGGSVKNGWSKDHATFTTE